VNTMMTMMKLITCFLRFMKKLIICSRPHALNR
jgi:hypothetical protein